MVATLSRVVYGPVDIHFLPEKYSEVTVSEKLKVKVSEFLQVV